MAELEANPVVRAGSALYPAAQFVDNSGVNVLDYRPFEDRKTYDLTGKLDASIGKAVDVTFSGTYYKIENQFTPDNWRVFNSHNNPTSNDERYRANVRLRHRLGGASTSADGGQKGSFIQNAAYVLQFGYEKNKFSVGDPRHKDNLFDYGYIGKYDLTWEPTVPTVIDTIINDTVYIVPQHVDYTRIFSGYTPGDKNPVLTRYILNGEDNDNFNDFDVLNGSIPTNLSNVWSNHHTNVGAVYNLNRKRDSDIYTFSATSSFELVPSGSGENRHSIQFGILYEQRTNRGYDISPRGLWTIARGHANEHIDGQGLDSSIVLSVLDTVTTVVNQF
ncbi:MAG: TonB-dependent receptor, partial [Bacteroidota bacterium]